MPTKAELQDKLNKTTETLKERLTRIEELKAEADRIQEEFDTYLTDADTTAVDVGQTALQELRSLCELSGPYEALAFAHAVFEGLNGLVEADSTYKVDLVNPFPSETKEYRASAHRWAIAKNGRIL